MYIAAALTDLLDGMFARRGAPPRNDVDLDGIADVILSFATILWFWLLIPGFVSKYWLPYLLIVWGDVPWFAHSVLIIGVASKVHLAWLFWNCDNPDYFN